MLATDHQGSPYKSSEQRRGMRSHWIQDVSGRSADRTVGQQLSFHATVSWGSRCHPFLMPHISGAPCKCPCFVPRSCFQLESLPRYELLRAGIQASWFSSPCPQGPALCSVGWAVFPAPAISCAWRGGAALCPAFPPKMLCVSDAPRVNTDPRLTSKGSRPTGYNVGGSLSLECSFVKRGIKHQPRVGSWGGHQGRRPPCSSNKTGGSEQDALRGSREMMSGLPPPWSGDLSTSLVPVPPFLKTMLFFYNICNFWIWCRPVNSTVQKCPGWRPGPSAWHTGGAH